MWTDADIFEANLEDFSIGAECRGEVADEGMCVIGDIVNVVAATKKIISQDSEVFRVSAWSADQSLNLDSTARAIVAAVRTDFTRIDRFFTGDLNSHYLLFRECMSKLDERLVWLYDVRKPGSKAEWAQWAEKLNAFVKCIRSTAKQQWFIKLLQNYSRGVNKNRASLNAHIDKIFAQKSKVLVLRLDLTYGRDSQLSLTYDDADRHRRSLLNDVQHRLYKDSYVGYVWKLEYGLMSSLHYHLLIFLDAQKVRSDVLIAQAIGEHWQNSVTQGRGRYWNCNARKAGYRKCGIGAISHNDKLLRSNLKMAADYLVKADYFVRSMIPLRRRTFGKGASLLQKKSNRGRPRL
ncbi:YagK/YfjJ domain-containing protein [Pseudomonas viridiflava]|uniref:YagK/YfjJ domain-containing protein n=1 Tax=Pseudomonas viridiflava TaxID=33069 RepID=UPI0013CE9AF2|nr:inovirus-type Gp2 protein [Pseudomonas viridiflava]